ncbi:MAG: hypothetical protein CVT92_08660 [Bacteroidetes bacterium HGW-Bacteroidetes-1]|nr:MAG: hypothetical protein CVT92_08660 [Bacteroidetes bacterium HGW-Bacteroidetes-1]
MVDPVSVFENIPKLKMNVENSQIWKNDKINDIYVSKQILIHFFYFLVPLGLHICNTQGFCTFVVFKKFFNEMNIANPLRRLFLFLRRSITWPLLILSIVILIFYLTAPFYKFEAPQPFSGNFIHNPYENVLLENWKNYNFQTHTNYWKNLMKGNNSTEYFIDSIYQHFGFINITISDYQYINKRRLQNENYIPTYKHGFGFQNIYQICIGANKVQWTDYPFYQALRHKQSIIDKLRSDCDLIAISSPLSKNGYQPSDLKYLSGYDLIEVSNNQRNSISLWDTALTYGHRVYIFAGDDHPEGFIKGEEGHHFTMVNLSDQQRDSFVEALRQGAAYGLDFFAIENEPLADKAERLKNKPQLINAELLSDTFKVAVDQLAESFKFIGQHGKLFSLVEDTNAAEYIIKVEDLYVRTEVTFPDGTILYLNPLIRHPEEIIRKQHLAKIDINKTAIMRGIYIVVIVFLLQMIFKGKIRKNMTSL